jgi:hypothetical protein
MVNPLVRLRFALIVLTGAAAILAVVLNQKFLLVTADMFESTTTDDSAPRLAKDMDREANQKKAIPGSATISGTSYHA